MRGLTPLCLFMCVHPSERSVYLGRGQRFQNRMVSPVWRFWLQTHDFQQGQTQVVQGVQEAIQGGLIDDLADQDGLARDLPAQGEAGEPVRPLRSQLPLNAN